MTNVTHQSRNFGERKTLDCWGILGPEEIGRVRRTRTFGVISVVREYNDLAVPGLGNIFFGKQLLIALLGIRLAETLRQNGKSISNIAAANAVEALACLLKIQELGGSKPTLSHAAKLRGRLKLRHGDGSFRRLAAPGGYVTQPMRMATVQPLVALGLVDAGAGFRFNSYKCNERGNRFVQSSFTIGKGRPCPEYQLLKWAENRESITRRMVADYLDLFRPLAPAASAQLRELLAKDERREALINWMRKLPSSITLKHFEKATSVPNHADHIRDGANFMAMRDAASAILITCEELIRKSTKKEINLKSEAGSIMQNLHDMPAKLNAQAKSYGNNHLRLLESSRDASDFAKLCSKRGIELLSGLVKRDGNILRMIGDSIKPGPAFDYQSGSHITDNDDADESWPDRPHKTTWPDHISPRIINLSNLLGDIQQQARS